MREVYRKYGTILRYENGTMIRVHESGQAVEEDSLFACAPLRDRERLPDIEDGAVATVVGQVREAAGDLTIERLIVTDGRAEHEFEGRSWSDRNRRVHLSIANGVHRMLIDEGDFDVTAVESLARQFARIGRERPAPGRVRLSARVMAGLTQPMVNVAPPNVTVEQVAGGIDGKGQPIGASVGPAWPNVYRPSYRVRPMRLPINVAVRCSVTTVERGLPEAVALLAPTSGLVLRALCVDGDDVYPATLRVVRIDAVAGTVRWFPYGTGVWAGEAEVAT